MRRVTQNPRDEKEERLRHLAGRLPHEVYQTRINWTPERQCTSGGVAHVVLAAGNKWRGGDERRIGDQNADKTNLHDAH